MCVNPYIATRKDGTPVPVPCGHCLDCRKQYQTEWSFRVSQEMKRTPFPAFVTLTYNDENLPTEVDPDTGEVLGVVVKRDVQLWLKRLRRAGGAVLSGLRYFLVSEYGSRFNRPHYHAILVAPGIPNILYLRKLVEETWQKGFVKVDFATTKSVHYVTKYMNKIDERFHLVKPFRLYSRSIGLNFLTQRIVEYYLSTFDRTCINGRCKIGLPRYYKKKLDEYSTRDWKLSRAGLVYSDLLEDVKPVKNTKYWFLKDFTEHYNEYFWLGVKDLAQHHCDAEYMSENQLRQIAWYAYVRTHKIVQDMIQNDERIMRSCKIRNKLLGREPTSYNVTSSILSEAS